METSEIEKTITLISIANELLSNSIHLKKEITDMVDEDFWDLI